MAATIQHIELPKKPRALDSSTSIQEVSQELITEGDFGAGGANWSPGTGWTDTGGHGAWDTDATTSASVYQTIDALVVGATYKVVFTIRNSSGGKQLVRLEGVENQRVTDDGNGNLGYGTYGNDTHTIYFTALYANTEFNFYGHRDYSSFDVDDISLKRVDTFSNNNHGKIYSGRALEFDGVTDYLTIPVTQSLSDFTMSAWINFNAIPSDSSHEAGIISNTTQDLFGINNNAWIMKINNSWTSGISFSYFTPAINTWYRITLVRVGTDIRIYVNGIDIGIPFPAAGATLDDTFDISTIGRYGSDAYHLFDGMLSDLQIWDTAWTADDIAYDYANPESLALNASGSALTEGNLKLWYPMQDGHRGQQSYILDGANTGLGSKNIWGQANANTDNWNNFGAAENIVESDTDADAVKITYVDGASGVFNYLREDDFLTEDLVVGQTYKISIVTKVNQGSTVNWKISESDWQIIHIP